jgi:WD repeat-containing protein 1 (actin-interacting protein 1)
MATIEPRAVYCGVPVTARGEVTHISADPTGATDAVAYASGRVAVVRSTTRPLECSVFTLHANPVTCVRFAPDGQHVASGDEGGCVRYWDRSTYKQTMEAQVMSGPVRDIAFAPDAKHILVTGESRGGFALAVKVPSGGTAGTCLGHTKRVVACDISSKKPSLVATGSEDMSVGIFKGPPIREIDVPSYLKHHSAFVNDVRFSPDGNFLAIASSDRTVSIVDVATNAVVRTLTDHTGSVTGIAWTPDSASLYTSSNDKTTKMWRASDGKCLSTISYGDSVMDMQVGCAVCPKTKSLVSISVRGDINICSAGANAPTHTFRGHCKQIVGLAVVGSRAFSADYSGLMVAWDLGVGSSDKTFNGTGPTTSVCDVAANSQVIANVGQDGKIFVTQSNTLTYQKPMLVKGGGVGIAVPSAPSTILSAVMINETRLAAVSSTGDRVIAELDFARGETGTAVAVSPDASVIAVGIQVQGGSGELRFAKLSGGSTLAFVGESLPMPSPPNKLAFSPNSTIIAVGEASRRVKLYSVKDRTPVLGGGIVHTARVDALAFDSSGTRLASGGMDGSIAVWPVLSDSEPLRLLSAHRSGVTGIGFADSKTLVSSGGDSCLRAWSI